MSNITPTPRPGMTAIAALMALSSTPLLAQATDGAASQPPVIAAPAPAAATPDTPAAVQSVADAPAAPEAATPAPVEAVPVMRTVGTPVVHTEAAASDDVQAVAPRAARRVSTATTRNAVPVATVAPVKAAATPAPQTAPVLRTAAPAAVAAPVVAKTTTTQTATVPSIDNDAIPAAGLVGLGALAIGGLAFAFRRKRREDESEELAYEPTLVGAAPVVVAEPVVARTSSRSRAKPAVMPNGFDLSRYGPHVQAAYAGPTEDNPFLSLKRRLHRARFYDQREREAAAITAVEAPRSQPVAVRAAAKADAKTDAKKDERQVTVRMAPKRKTGKFGFAFAK